MIDGERIKIPHPKMHERPFVLRGLCEVAPDFLHPKLNKTVKQLYYDCNKVGGVNADILKPPQTAG